MNKPRFPIITIYNKSLDIIPTESHINKASIFGIFKGNLDSVAFDGDGKKWTYKLISDKVKDTFLTRFLANTFYNPVVDVTPIWTNTDIYKVQELKTTINELIDKDYDILTQFVESETLKQEINKSTSFNDISKVLNKYVFDVNEEELMKEETE